MRSTTVAFRGVAQVIDAYQANDIGPWAIVNAKSVMFADNARTVEEGVQSLQETLDRLQRGNSRAQFELRTYKISADADILSNTPHLRAFPFLLYEDSELTPFEYGRRKATDEYENRFAVMQKEIEELKLALAEAEAAEAEPPAKDNSVGAILSGLLEVPQIKQALQMKLVGLIDRVIPMNPSDKRPAAIAGVPGQSLLNADQQAKVQQAVNILCTKDALLGDHLLSIAKIATDDPGRFKMLIGFL